MTLRKILPNLLAPVLLILNLLQRHERKMTNRTTCRNTIQNYIASIQYPNNQEGLIADIVVYIVSIVIFGYYTFLLVTTCMMWWWKINSYNQLKKQYNKLENECMPREEFARKRDLLIETLRRSRRQNNFDHYVKGERQLINISFVKIVKSTQPLLTEIELEGEDLNTKWKARGCITSRNNQIFMWLEKDYEDWEKIPKAEGYVRMIYQSTDYDRWGLMSGRWFCKSFWDKYLSFGLWKLEETNLQNVAVEEPMVQNDPAEI